MSSPDSAISQKQIEEAFSETTSLQTGLAEDEMKERLRLDLENQIKIKTFQTRLQELRNRTGIEIYLSEPEPPLIRISDEGPSSGSPSSPVTIVEFSDFQCPFCKRASETVRELARLYDGKVRIVFKHFPLSNHPDAFKAAQASVCADEKGKFWEYHDRLFNSQNLSDESLRKIAADIGLETKDFNACLESSRSKEQVMKNIQEGRKIGIQGTPFFTINGRPVRGAQDISEFRRIIDRQLAGER
ncbi:MAG: DsbA family protein [Acidobacteria bacterium]|nr:DsbA family protein [Acidobacteriota bacterium]